MYCRNAKPSKLISTAATLNVSKMDGYGLMSQ